MALGIAPLEEVTFDIMSEPYGDFVASMRRALAATSSETVKEPTSNVERPVLPKQTGPDVQPPRWIHVTLRAKGGAAPKVAVRCDNTYIMGFTNSQGTWFQLSTTGAKEKLVAGNPVMTGFKGHYITLVGGVGNLTALDLRRFCTSDAALKLWNHSSKNLGGGGGGDDEATMLHNDQQLKAAVATLCVVVCEAARLAPVAKLVEGGWDSLSKVSITQSEVGYIRDWSDVSTAVLGWKLDKYGNDSKHFGKFAGIGIQTGEQALQVLQLVLQARRTGFLAWLKYLWNLLVANKLQQEDTVLSKKPKGSAIVNPL